MRDEELAAIRAEYERALPWIAAPWDEHLPALLDEVARLREVAGQMLGAFDPEWPGACGQECFDTSDGHGYERQEAAIRVARKVLAG